MNRKANLPLETIIWIALSAALFLLILVIIFTKVLK
jgi:hypothetical protein